jgi:tRNA1Val (adenine37-N6)-methyltransferase
VATAAGITRPARRPPGWRPPGPPPAASPDPALGPHDGEDLCYLAGDWRILQQIDGHRWSLDDLVTAWVATTVSADRRPARFADLGCGIGTVLMLVAWRFQEARGVGVEAQDVSVHLARRSLAWNGIAARAEVRHGDFRDPAVLSSADGALELVTGTPPYLTPGDATVSERVQCGPCRFEARGGVEDYLAAAARLLAPDGRFVMCAGALQHARVLAGAALAGLAVAPVLSVVPRAGKAPLFGVYVMRPAAAADALGPSAGSELVVRDRAGQWTAEFRNLRAVMGMPPSG